MITVWDQHLTAKQFAKYAVLSYGAFVARDFWQEHAELRDSHELMTERERELCDSAITEYVDRLLDKESYWGVHKKVFGED